MLMRENLGPLERKYRQHYLEADVRQSVYGLIFLQVPNLSFIYSDFHFFRMTDSFWPVFAMRISIFLISMMLAFGLTRVRKPRQLDVINAIFTLALVVAVSLIVVFRPQMYLTNMGLDALVILGCYLMFPNSMKLRTLPAVLYAIFLLSFLIWDRDGIQPASMNAIFLVLFLANVMGFFISNQFQYYRRKRFGSYTKLLKMQGELKILANSDPLTDLPNRRHFLELGQIEWQRFKRYERDFSLFIIDLDHFKSINDQYGHSAGDTALVAFANKICYCLRSADVLGRIGGEEFGILLPETKLFDALRIADRLRQVIANMRIEAEGGSFTISISIGVAQAQVSDESLVEMMKRADRALYQAKESGRDKVCVA